MKKLYFLDESEKERILNMHKDATKKQYLIEGKSNVLKNYFLMEDDIETTMTTVNPNAKINIKPFEDKITKPNEKDDEYSIPWVGIGAVIGVLGGAVIVKRVLPKNIKEKIANAWNWTKNFARDTVAPAFPRYRKSLEETLTLMKNGGLMTEDGRVFVLIETKPITKPSPAGFNQPINVDETIYTFKEFNLQTYLNTYLKQLRTKDGNELHTLNPKENPLTVAFLTDIEGRALIDRSIDNARKTPGLDKTFQVTVDSNGYAKHNVVGEPDIKIEINNGALTLNSKVSKLSQEMVKSKNWARILKALGFLISLPYGSLRLTTYFAGRTAGQYSYSTFKNNLPEIMKFLDLEEVDSKQYVGNLCNVSDDMIDALQGREVLSVADPKTKDIINGFINTRNYNKVGEFIEKMEIYRFLALKKLKHISYKNGKSIEYGPDSPNGCYHQFMLESMGEKNYQNFVIQKTKKKFREAYDTANKLLNLKDFWAAVEEASYTDVYNGTTGKISDLAGYKQSKESFMRNCPCLLSGNLEQWMYEDVYPMVLIAENTPNKKLALMFTDKKRVITDSCNDLSYQTVIDAIDSVATNSSTKGNAIKYIQEDVYGINADGSLKAPYKYDC